MSDHETALLDIQVDTDDYASTAAGDVPSAVPRTHQSEADFEAQKALYCAKVDGDSNYAILVNSIPFLSDNNRANGSSEQEGGAANGVERKLTKKEVQLLGYAAAELYYERKYDELLRLCRRVQELGVGGHGKVEESLGRWMRRCEERKKEEARE